MLGFGVVLSKSDRDKNKQYKYKHIYTFNDCADLESVPWSMLESRTKRGNQSQAPPFLTEI